MAKKSVKTEIKHKGGRPNKDEAERMVSLGIRVLPHVKAKFQALPRDARVQTLADIRQQIENTVKQHFVKAYDLA